MKKIVALLLVLLLSCAAFAEGTLLGGWTPSEAAPLPMPEEAVEAFDKAMAGRPGVAYEPMALLATQVVAGMNYCFLCRATDVTPELEDTWNLIYVYRDLQGKATVIETEDLDLEIDEPDDDDDDDDDDDALVGGWTAFENEAAPMSEDAEAAFSKALEGLVGAAYTPLAELGTQVVAGRNYCLFCAITPVVPNAVTTYAQVYIYENLQGAAQIVSVDDVEIGID